MTVIGTIRDATTALTASVEARKQTPTGNALNVQIGPGDVISNIPVVMDFGQHQVHEGESHHANDERLTLGTTTVKYGLTVPVYATTINAPHLIISVDCYDGAALVRMYEGATFTGGAAVTSYNRNRNSATAPGMTITSGVTSTNGTLIDSMFVGSGQKSAGSGRGEDEWVLKSNTIYRVDVIGQVGATQAIVQFHWYEDLGV